MTLANSPARVPGRQFLQIPGPTPIPDRVLRAMDMPIIDHRGPKFKDLTARALDGMKSIFKTTGAVMIYPSSGTGAWEAALANALSPGDQVLMFESGHFSALWKAMAERFGIQVDYIASDWREAADPSAIEQKLRDDKAHAIKAVCVVHNETSTGTISDIAAIRRAVDAAGHPALLMVDTVSSLGSADFQHDAWGVDVTVCSSQKGLMLPPGLGFNAVSDEALARARTADLPRLYWSWDEMIKANQQGSFPYTPATNTLYGLVEAVEMMHEEGLDRVFARHIRHGEAARRAAKAWGLDIQCSNPAHYSPVVTTVVMPEGHGGDAFRALALERFDIALGSGLSKLADKVFRIGHLGDINDLTLLGALAGVEMSLKLAGVPSREGGVLAAMAHLAQTSAA